MRGIPWHCHHVLPLVYDESLSYYEDICKLTHKINEVIENIANNLESYLQSILEDTFVDVVYNESTETITFTLTTH